MGNCRCPCDLVDTMYHIPARRDRLRPRRLRHVLPKLSGDIRGSRAKQYTGQKARDQMQQRPIMQGRYHHRDNGRTTSESTYTTMPPAPLAEACGITCRIILQTTYRHESSSSSSSPSSSFAFMASSSSSESIPSLWRIAVLISSRSSSFSSNHSLVASRPWAMVSSS